MTARAPERTIAETAGARAACWWPWALGLLVALLAAWQLRYLLLLTPRELGTHGLLADDAFFYSVLARNYAHLGFLSLDGEMPTNGVQPLWMILQILLRGLFPGSHEVTALALVSWAVYLLVCLLAVRLVARRAGLGALGATILLAGFVLLNTKFQASTIQGLETPLALLWIVLLWMTLRKVTSSGSRPGVLVLLGVLAALCFLTRTDQFWPAVLIGAWLVFRRRVSWQAFLCYAAPLALLVLPYLVYNLSVHGGLMPISGRVKLHYVSTFYPSWSAYFGSEEWTALMRAFSDLLPVEAPGAPVWAPLLFIAAVALAWRGGSAGALGAGGRLLALGFLAHALTLHLFYRELMPRNTYYFAPTVLWAGVIFAEWLGGAGRRDEGGEGDRGWGPRRWRGGLAALAAVVALVVMAANWSGRKIEEEPYWARRIQVADDIREMLPAGARVGAFWPGAFAQFSGRPVIPLDGVIGSRHYFEEYLQEERELDYLLERQPAFLAVHLPLHPDTLVQRQAIPLREWTQVGVQRVWEQRASLRFDVVTARRVARTPGAGGGGWCLLHVRPRGNADLP